MSTKTPDLAAIDAQIVAAQQELDAAQNRWRSRPRHGATLGQGPIRIDPEAAADKLDRGLAVDQAIIQLETFKRQRAELVLAELTDPAELARLEAAEHAALIALEEAEVAAKTVRTAYQAARREAQARQERITIYQAEMARAQAAIRSAEQAREREQTERSTLMTA